MIKDIIMRENCILLRSYGGSLACDSASNFAQRSSRHIDNRPLRDKRHVAFRQSASRKLGLLVQYSDTKACRCLADHFHSDIPTPRPSVDCHSLHFCTLVLAITTLL